MLLEQVLVIANTAAPWVLIVMGCIGLYLLVVRLTVAAANTGKR